MTSAALNVRPGRYPELRDPRGLPARVRLRRPDDRRPLDREPPLRPHQRVGPPADPLAPPPVVTMSTPISCLFDDRPNPLADRSGPIVTPRLASPSP
jgi:hypothetical protein